VIGHEFSKNVDYSLPMVRGVQ